MVPVSSSSAWVRSILLVGVHLSACSAYRISRNRPPPLPAAARRRFVLARGASRRTLSLVEKLRSRFILARGDAVGQNTLGGGKSPVHPRSAGNVRGFPVMRRSTFAPSSRAGEPAGTALTPPTALSADASVNPVVDRWLAHLHRVLLIARWSSSSSSVLAPASACCAVAVTVRRRSLAGVRCRLPSRPCARSPRTGSARRAG